MQPLFSDPRILAYRFGIAFAVPFPELFIPPIMRHIWLRVLDHNKVPRDQIKKDIEFLARLVGLIERTLYVASILAGAPEFIGIWLAIKVAGGWKGWSDQREYSWSVDGGRRKGHVPGRQEFNAFLIGSSLSLLFAVAGAYCIGWLQCGRLLATLAVDAPLVAGSLGLISWLKRPDHVASEP